MNSIGITKDYLSKAQNFYTQGMNNDVPKPSYDGYVPPENRPDMVSTKFDFNKNTSFTPHYKKILPAALKKLATRTRKTKTRKTKTRKTKTRSKPRRRRRRTVRLTTSAAPFTPQTTSTVSS